MNNKERNNLIAFGITFVGTAGYLYWIYCHAKKEAEKHAKTKQDLDRELEAIHHSGEIIRLRITRGEYDGKPFKDVERDFEFEKIAYLNK